MRLKKNKKLFIKISVIFLLLFCLYKFLDYKYDQPRVLGEIIIENLDGYNIEIRRGARDDDWENSWVNYYFKIKKNNHSYDKENNILDKIVSDNFIFLIDSDYGYNLYNFEAKFIDSIFFIKINTYQIEYPYFFDFKTNVGTYNKIDFLNKIEKLPENIQDEKLDSVQELRDSILNYIKSIDKQNVTDDESIIKFKTAKEPLILLGIILLLICGLYKYLDYKYNKNRVLGNINLENLEEYTVEIKRGEKENNGTNYYFRIKNNHLLDKENNILNKIISDNFQFLINTDFGCDLDDFEVKFIDNIFFIKVTTGQIEYPYFFDLKTGIGTFYEKDSKNLDSVQQLRDSIEKHIKSLDK